MFTSENRLKLGTIFLNLYSKRVKSVLAVLFCIKHRIQIKTWKKLEIEREMYGIHVAYCHFKKSIGAKSIRAECQLLKSIFCVVNCFDRELRLLLFADSLKAAFPKKSLNFDNFYHAF